MIVQDHGFFYKIIGKKECITCDKYDINEIKKNQAHEKDR